jgi:hypothetical protein
MKSMKLPLFHSTQPLKNKKQMLNLWGAFWDFKMQLIDIGIIHTVPPYNGIHTYNFK